MLKNKIQRFLVFLLAFVVITMSSNGALQFTNVVKAAGTPVDVTGLGGTITAQYADSPVGEEKEKAFDNQVTTKYLTPHASAWIQFQFAGSKSYAVYKYSITSANDVPLRDPKNWTLAGSTNGTTWTTLDTRSNEAFTARYQRREFSFTNTTTYAYYRLSMTNNGPDGGTNKLQVAEIELFADLPMEINRTDGGGTITTQYTDSPASEQKEKAFDNNINTKFLTPHASAWIQFQFASAYPINKYRITSANDVPLRDPKNWTLAGSTNGTTWTTLDTRSNEVFASRYKIREFLFTNTTAYAYYRLTMTNNGPDGGTNKLQVAEIDFFENGQPNTAYSWTLGPFTRPVTTPVIQPNANLTFSDPMTGTTVKWAQGQTFNPASIVVGSTMNVLFRAEDGAGVGIGAYTSRVGRATSTDGINFTLQSTPVEYPKNDAWKNYDWYGGDEDPRVVQSETGMYALYYTMYNRDNPGGLATTARLGVSTSTDLVNWTKHGPAFWNSGNSSVLNSFHKSASVVQKVVNGKLVAAMINGKYWMYWGEDAVHLATSTDLINWVPVMNGSSLLTIFSTRAGNFDSMLTECGPPAILTNNGIVMIYNGKNSTDTTKASSLVAPGAYSCGQALFSATNPAQLLDRLPEPFFKPELAFEKSGQYPQGTTFAEGLSLFNGKWYLYYGTADTFVGVATAPANY